MMKKYKIGKKLSDKSPVQQNFKETSVDKRNKKNETTKEKVNSGPSSPKRSKMTPERNNETSESNDNDYNDVFILTQDKNIDVTWDWNGTPKSKKNDRTPKRSKFVHKKRISNSPLLYNSTKRKIIRKENTNTLDKLKADMIALQATITEEKNAPSSETAHSSNGNDISNQSDNDDEEVDIPKELKFDEDFGESVLIVSLPEDSTRTKISDAGACDSKNKNIDDMFDDSMNDTMIRCSQEIEKALKITPSVGNNNNCNSSNTKNYLNPASSFSRSKSSNEFANLPGTSKCQPQNNYKNVSVCKPQNYLLEQTSKLVSEENNAKFIKHKSDSIVKSSNGNFNAQLKTSNVQERNNCRDINTESEEDGFLDDSFDDFFASCETDLTKTESIILTGQSTNTLRVYSPRGKSALKTTNTTNPLLPKEPNPSSISFPSANPIYNKTNRNTGVPTIRPTGAIPKNPSLYNNSSNYNNSNSNNSNNSGRGFQRTSSSSNLRPNAPTKVDTSKKSQDWKFFKSKSVSDSSFEHKTNTKPGLQNTKSHSNLRNNFKVNNTNTSSKSGRMFASGSVSNEHLAVRRITSCLDSNSGKRNIVKDNTQFHNNVDRFGGRRNGNLNVSRNNDATRQTSALSARGVSSSSSRDVSVGMQSLQLYTPEEIERKRVEAKMKLEARKKKLQASNSDSSGNSLRSNER